MDDSCGDVLTDTDVDDDTGADDLCDDSTSAEREWQESPCVDEASDADPCAEADDSDDSDHPADSDDPRCGDQPRAASGDGDACHDDEPRDARGDTLAAVDDGSDSPEPTVDAGLADPGAVAPLIPVDIPVPDRVATFEAIPGIGGDTAAVLGSVSGQLADAGRIAHAPLTAGAATEPGFVAATERADIAGRAAAALSPLVTGEEMRNDVIADDQRRQALIAAREAESESLLVLEEAEGALGDV